MRFAIERYIGKRVQACGAGDGGSSGGQPHGGRDWPRGSVAETTDAPPGTVQPTGDWPQARCPLTTAPSTHATRTVIHGLPSALASALAALGARGGEGGRAILLGAGASGHPTRFRGPPRPNERATWENGEQWYITFKMLPDENCSPSQHPPSFLRVHF